MKYYPNLRSKLSPLRHDGVEVAEGEEDALELGLLGAHLQRVLLEVVQGLVQVGLHPCWRFVGDLDGSFQNALRNDVLIWNVKDEKRFVYAS